MNKQTLFNNNKIDKVEVDDRVYEVEEKETKGGYFETDPEWMKANLSINVYCYIQGDRIEVQNSRLLSKIYRRWKNGID